MSKNGILRNKALPKVQKTLFLQSFEEK